MSRIGSPLLASIRHYIIVCTSAKHGSLRCPNPIIKSNLAVNQAVHQLRRAFSTENEKPGSGGMVDLNSNTRAPETDLETMRARLRYQSKKRGILENDIILGGFADEKLKALDRSQLLQYDHIINGKHMEWDLYYYMSGNKTPPEELSGSEVFWMLRSFVDEKAMQFGKRNPTKSSTDDH